MDGTRRPGPFWSTTLDRRQLLKALGVVGSVLALDGPTRVARALADGQMLSAAEIVNRAPYPGACWEKPEWKFPPCVLAALIWVGSTGRLRPFGCYTKPSMPASPSSTMPGNITMAYPRNGWARDCRAVDTGVPDDQGVFARPRQAGCHAATGGVAAPIAHRPSRPVADSRSDLRQ